MTEHPTIDSVAAERLEVSAEWREHNFLRALDHGIAKAAKPSPRIRVDEWADTKRKLGTETSATPGQWRTSRVEYTRGVMQAMSDPRVWKIVLRWSSQCGKSEMLLNCIGFQVDMDPGPILGILPTLENAKDFSKRRIAPMIRDTPALKEKFGDHRTRDSGNTTLMKEFPGGIMRFSGSNSPASLASMPIRLLIGDEISRWSASAGNEGAPNALAEKRTTTFWNRKVVYASSPTIAGSCLITTEYNESDKRLYFVACPACGHLQILRWEQVKWEPGRPETAYYLCPEEKCGAWWSDLDRWQAVKKATSIEGGGWRAMNSFNGVAGFHLNEIYSPFIELADMAERFLKARHVPELLKVFVNTALAECWEEKGMALDADHLMTRAREYGPDDLPGGIKVKESEDAPAIEKPGPIVVTAGVDVQQDRIEIETVGWGHNEVSWSIEFRVFYGEPTGPDLWETVKEFLINTRYQREDGAVLRIVASCVDTGGSATQSVYDFVGDQPARHRIWAIKGHNVPGKPIFPLRGSKVKGRKFPLFMLGVDAAKERIYNQLALNKEGLPGYCNFPIDRDPEWYDGLTSEVRQPRKLPDGTMGHRWILKQGKRNEPLDCRVYALAALRGLNPNMQRVNASLKRNIVPGEKIGHIDGAPNLAVEHNKSSPPPQAKRKGRRRLPRRRRR